MTLQDLCLDKIVQLFDRFNFAFTTGKDVHVKRRFEFLQRKYSFRILQKLSENNCIKDEHADFLFNRHLKVLDTEWLSYCSWEIVKRKFAEIGPSLQKLCINHEMKDEIKWAKFLRHIPNIKVIWSNGFCDNAFLRGIAQYCHNIETLDIKDSDMVTDHGLKFLCLKKKGKFQCPLLKELYISGTSIEHAGMKYLLQHMPTLERTDYAELDEVLYEIHKNSINALDKVKPYNLTHLDLMHIVYFGHRSDILKISLSVCPRVKVLSCPVFNEEQLKLCSNLIELEVLHLDCYTDTSIEINDFLMLRGNNLVTLGIQKFSLLASVLALNCPCLNVLQMNDVTFQSDDKDSIPMLHNLEELSLENCKFSDTQTSKSLVLLLSSSPNLTQLCFKNCDSFTSEIKTQVLKCCELCQLKQSLETLYHTDGRNNCGWVVFLCHIENIKVIYFPYYCDDEFLLGIAQYCHKIESLNVEYSNQVSDFGIQSLCPQGKDRPACPVLKELFIKDTAVGNDGMRYLLQHLPSLEKCDYSKLVEALCEIHKADIETLDRVERYNLTQLNLMNVAHSEHFNDILQMCVSLCPNVKVLSCPVFNEAQLKLCTNFIRLEDLDIDCCADSWIEINEFLKIRGNKLTSLGMRNFSFSASVLAVACSQLNVLRMNLVNFQYDDNNYIPVMHNLREFTLEKCVFVDTLTSKSVGLFLSSSPNLEQLSFKNCNSFTSEIKTQILKCCEHCPIHLICFSNSSVEPQLFKDILLTCSTLDCMDLDGCVVETELENDIFRIALSLPNNPEINLNNETDSDNRYDDLFNGYDDFLDDDDIDDDIDDVDYDDYGVDYLDDDDYDL